MQMIKGQRTYADGRTRTAFEAVSDGKPSVAEWQIQLSYHPNGYSGPWNVEKDGKFVTTWKL